MTTFPYIIHDGPAEGEFRITTEQIIAELRNLGHPDRALHFARFFKTGAGQYGEGDLFLGVSVPEQRAIARKYSGASFSVLGELLASPWHEVRLTGLLVLLRKFEKAPQDKDRKACADFYLSQTLSINNWDLVDLTCYKLLGPWLKDKNRQPLHRLSVSGNLWEQRIAIVTCLYFVRRGDFSDCLAIADRLLHHPHDLIHKAVGWLLREVGKKDLRVLVNFLAPRFRQMPRTTLRYAIEHFPEEERKKYLHK